MVEVTPPAGPISGTVLVDGSSTVGPITQAVAEEFQKQFPDVRVPVGISGTGGGFKKFCVKETDISDASRFIKSSRSRNSATRTASRTSSCPWRSTGSRLS